MAAAIVLTAVIIDLREWAARPTPLPLDAVAPAPVPHFLTARRERPHYRHSVIAGGAYSGDELAAAMREDAIVAAHHEDMDIDRVHAVVTSQPRLAYVSYRLGGRVYWTRKPVQIPAGETLLTDGINEIRARCGNGVSDIAREPVSDVEPIAAELDEAIDPGADSSTSGERTLANTAPIGPAFVPFFQLAQAAVGGVVAPSDVPDELFPLVSTPTGLLAFLLDPVGTITTDGTSPPEDGVTSLFDEGGPLDPDEEPTELVDVDDPFDGGGGDSPGGDPGPGGPGGEGPGDGDGNPGGGDEGPGDTPTDPGGEYPIDIDPEIHDVPEPGTLALLGLALGVMAARQKRQVKLER